MTNLSSLVEAIAKQALGGGQQQNTQSNNQNNSQSNSNAGGLGGILGSVLGQVMNQSGNTQQSNANQSGLGGILGSVLGQLGGSSQAKQTSSLGGNKTALLIAVLPVVLAWIQKQGGIQGALEKLTNSGLASQVQSWVDPNATQNDTVPTSQVEQLFNDEEIDKIAEQTQEPKQDIYAAIATVLPQIIDSLTPNGTATDKGEANNDIQNVLSTISGFLKK